MRMWVAYGTTEYNINDLSHRKVFTNKPLWGEIGDCGMIHTWRSHKQWTRWIASKSHLQRLAYDTQVTIIMYHNRSLHYWEAQTRVGKGSTWDGKRWQLLLVSQNNPIRSKRGVVVDFQHTWCSESGERWTWSNLYRANRDHSVPPRWTTKYMCSCYIFNHDACVLLSLSTKPRVTPTSQVWPSTSISKQHRDPTSFHAQ